MSFKSRPSSWTIRFPSRYSFASESKKLAERIKYVVIAGDLVDGIGVYPNQIKELNIVDINEQYEVAAEMLTNLPDYIEVIIILAM